MIDLNNCEYYVRVFDSGMYENKLLDERGSAEKNLTDFLNRSQDSEVPVPGPVLFQPQDSPSPNGGLRPEPQLPFWT